MPFKRHHQVTIYTSAGDQYSQFAKDYFREAGVDFDEVNISLNKESAQQLFALTNDAKTPVVDFDGRIIEGYQPDLYTILVNSEEK